jgi:hypothetical protein
MTKHDDNIPSPWRIGLRAAKANAIPAFVLQAACLGLILSYYYFPAVERALRPVSAWQEEYGVLAAFVSRAVFGGLLPGVFLLTVPALKVKRPALTIAVTSVFWGLMGILFLWLYAVQSWMFGTGHDWSTLILKTLVDQLTFTVFIGVPLVATFSFWQRHDYSLAATRTNFPRQWVRRLILPTLLPNWCVWAPSMFIIYALPQPLQIHFSGLVGCFWTLFCMQVAVHASDHR